MLILSAVVLVVASRPTYNLHINHLVRNIAPQQTISFQNDSFELSKMRFLLLKSRAMAEVQCLPVFTCGW
jgi:hypothetical protein